MQQACCTRPAQPVGDLRTCAGQETQVARSRERQSMGERLMRWSVGWVSRSVSIILLVASGCDVGVIGSGVERTFVEQGFDRGVVAVASARRVSRERLWEQGKAIAPVAERQDQVVVEVFGNRGYCPACKRFLAWWNGLTEAERGELPMRFAYREDSIPDFAARWGRPAFYWKGKNGENWMQEGWSGIEEFLKNYRRSQ